RVCCTTSRQDRCTTRMGNNAKPYLVLVGFASLTPVPPRSLGFPVHQRLLKGCIMCLRCWWCQALPAGGLSTGLRPGSCIWHRVLLTILRGSNTALSLLRSEE